jgi:hypothetical protein
MKKYIVQGVVLAGFGLLAACGNAGKNKDMEKKTVIDPHSYSRPGEALIKHLDLDLAVDFQKKKLSGKASYTIEKATDAKELILDSRDITISKITLNDDTAGAAFATGVPDEVLGTPVIIKLKPETEKVTVYYETSPVANVTHGFSIPNRRRKIPVFVYPIASHPLPYLDSCTG